MWDQHTTGSLAVLSALMFAAGLTSLIGSLVATAVADRLPRWHVYTWAYILRGTPYAALFVLGLPLPWLFAGLAVVGLAAGTLNPVIGAVELERVPEQWRARAFGAIGAVSQGGMVFGSLLGGWLASTLGYVGGLWVCAALLGALTAMPLVIPAFRTMDRARSTTTEPISAEA
jgi:MFS family permease